MAPLLATLDLCALFLNSPSFCNFTRVANKGALLKI